MGHDLTTGEPGKPLGTYLGLLVTDNDGHGSRMLAAGKCSSEDYDPIDAFEQKIGWMIDETRVVPYEACWLEPLPFLTRRRSSEGPTSHLIFTAEPFCQSAFKRQSSKGRRIRGCQRI